MCWKNSNSPEKCKNIYIYMFESNEFQSEDNVCLFCKCLQVEALNHKIIIFGCWKERGDMLKQEDISDPDSVPSTPCQWSTRSVAVKFLVGNTNLHLQLLRPLELLVFIHWLLGEPRVIIRCLMYVSQKGLG